MFRISFVFSLLSAKYRTKRNIRKVSYLYIFLPGVDEFKAVINWTITDTEKVNQKPVTPD